MARGRWSAKLASGLCTGLQSATVSVDRMQVCTRKQMAALADCQLVNKACLMCMHLNGVSVVGPIAMIR